MQDRRVEWNFSQGWVFAGFITALAVAAYITAGVIKSRTYHPPTDPLAPTSGQKAAH
jgi:hypothetical protein